MEMMKNIIVTTQCEKMIRCVKCPTCHRNMTIERYKDYSKYPPFYRTIWWCGECQQIIPFYHLPAPKK